MLRPQPARRGFVHAAGSRSDEGAQEARVAAQSQVYRTKTLERLDALDKRMEEDFQARLAATQTGPYTAEDRAKDDAYVQFKNQLKGAKVEVAQTGGFGDAGFLERFFGDLVETAIYTPAGVYELGKAVGFDVRDLATQGDITPERSAKLGKQIAVQTAEDIRHPLRHPGFTALDVFALGTAGYGAGSRVAAAGRAGAAASRAGAGPVGAARSALTRAPSEGGSLLRRPLPGRIELAEGVEMPASANPMVARVQRKRVAEQQKDPERIFAAHLPGRRLPSRIGTGSGRRPRGSSARQSRLPRRGWRRLGRSPATSSTARCKSWVRACLSANGSSATSATWTGSRRTRHGRVGSGKARGRDRSARCR